MIYKVFKFTIHLYPVKSIFKLRFLLVIISLHIIFVFPIQVMSSSTDEDEEAGSGALSPSDLFYKHVTGVGRALVRACRWCAEQDESGCEPPALSALISKVNLVILVRRYSVLSNARYRRP